MRQLKRPAVPPKVLSSPEAAHSRREMLEFWSLDPARRAQTSVPRLGLAPDHEDLVGALAEMTNGRCAFCEAQDKLLIHRFRPAGNALPNITSRNAHLYYVWLADAWQNLLPICQGCIPKEPQFPVTGARAPIPPASQIVNYVDRNDGIWQSYPPNETPQLVDPVRETAFDKHLLPKLDGELAPQSIKGANSILIHNLNRSDRRGQRYQVYQERIDELLAQFRTSNGAPFDPERNGLCDFANLEFGGSWYLLLRRIARSIGGSSGVRWRTSASHIRTFFVRLADTVDGADRLRAALNALSAEDDNLERNGWKTATLQPVMTSIEAIEIRNFKSIEALDLTLTNLDSEVKETSARRQPSLVILGENATGKSSILEAIALTLATDDARDLLEIPWRRLTLDAAQLGVDDQVETRDARVSLRLEERQSVHLIIRDGRPLIESTLPNGCVPVFAYGAFRRFLTGSRNRAAHKHIRNLFDGSTLSNPEPWLKKLPKDHFDLVVRTLRDLLSIEGSFEVIQRDPRTRKLCVINAVAEPDGSTRFLRTPLDSVSSGYRSMLAMLCDILHGLLDPSVYGPFVSFQSARGIVLIDEIEAHLHPRWKVQVMSSLRKALPNMTFIVTTHDPLCLRGMDDGEVVALQRIATSDSASESTLPTIVEKIENLPSVADLRIEQLLTSDFFQLLSTDDIEKERRLARVADMIDARKKKVTLDPLDAAVLKAFEDDVASALPVGSTEVHRIIQDALAEYLGKRRTASSDTLKSLRDDAKEAILAALETN